MKFIEKVDEVLKDGGFKLTSQRRAIVAEIATRHEHLTPAAIYERVHHKHPKIGLVTIYRTIEILAELGLICEVHRDGGRGYLLRRPAGHHHHLVCSGCGKVVDFTRCDVSGIEQRLSQETGFAIESHLLEFSGRCRECQRLER